MIQFLHSQVQSQRNQKLALLQVAEKIVQNDEIQPGPSNSQVVPFNAKTPKQPAIKIPNEYDFDLLELLSDIPASDMMNVQKVPQNTLAVMTTTNTQINLQRTTPEMPSFNNSSIGTINFNVINK